MSKEEEINRSNWETHPQYHRSGASKLIMIHSHFRQTMDEILLLIEKENFKKAKKVFIELESHLDLHHHIEEDRMFPFMKKIIGEKDAKKLYGDHKTLTKHLDLLMKMFEKEIVKEDLEELFKKFKTDTVAHLDIEENLAIPVIIKHGLPI